MEKKFPNGTVIVRVNGEYDRYDPFHNYTDVIGVLWNDHIQTSGAVIVRNDQYYPINFKHILTFSSKSRYAGYLLFKIFKVS
jgi:hypothetical protein